ncbi:hypothetical protein POK33_09080 [Burkholderia cenocepacia]|uniref:hypothetical protein n=1 Tax=Burkholderia cenocepacia TaxID=95486 RepID=UPI0023B93395|nr:hypothetical protein [Burkholderia cenocepacia]MDF0500883.1 hypothetical protein [Burkholderia cenocepacia]MDT6993231.1 hypothetical protein [Burkholderia cenocepacia]
MNDDAWFRFVSIVYFTAASLAAICTIVSIVAGVAQYRVSNRISDAKDRELAAVNQQAAVANEKAAVANEKAADLNKKTALLEADNLRMKQQLTWRELDKHQVAALMGALQKAPDLKVALVSMMGDAEGDNYLEQFADVFRQSKPDIDNFTFQSVFTKSISGLLVGINPDDRGDASVIRMANVLGNALEAAKIADPRQLIFAPVVPRGHVAIVIGAKPSFAHRPQH